MTAWDLATRKRYDLTLALHDYPAWDGPPNHTLLLCSEPRSGSTLLGEALYFAGGLGCPLEYFHAGFRPDFEMRWDAHDAAAYLAETHRNRTAPNGTFATKLFWRDVLELIDERDAVLAAEMRASTPDEATPEIYRAVAATLAALFDRATIVHLTRIDRVRGAVSADLAGQTGLWRAIPGVGEHEPLAEPKFDFDRIAGLVAYAAQAHAHWNNMFEAIDARPIRLTYEGLTQNYTRTVTDLLLQLGQTAVVGEPRMQRQSSRLSEDFTLRYLRQAQARSRG